MDTAQMIAKQPVLIVMVKVDSADVDAVLAASIKKTISGILVQ